MMRVLAANRFAIRVSALFVVVLAAALATPTSGIGYSPPGVALLAATLPASSVIPVDVHVLRILREEETGTFIEIPAVCYSSFTPDPPPYDAHYDRGPALAPYGGPNVWDMTEPDGVIDQLNDILGVIAQNGHNCT